MRLVPFERVKSFILVAMVGVGLVGSLLGLGVQPLPLSLEAIEAAAESGFLAAVIEVRFGARFDEIGDGAGPANAQTVEELVKLLGDILGGPVFLVASAGLSVESSEEGEGETVVEAVALAPDLAVADDHLDAAIEGAGNQLVVEPVTGDLERRGPAEMEAAAGSAAAKGISALLAHAGRAGGIGDHSALGKGAKEDSLALGRPSVVAAGGRRGFGGSAEREVKRTERLSNQSIGDAWARRLGRALRAR